MSMNLHGVLANGCYIDFPFQTPTELSYKVLYAPPEKRLGILKKYIYETWDDCPDIADSLYKRCKAFLEKFELDVM